MALTNSIGFIAITVILCAAMCNGKNLYDDTELSGPEGLVEVKRPAFYAGSRYGRSNGVQTSLRITPRRDFHFLRYGKRSDGTQDYLARLGKKPDSDEPPQYLLYEKRGNDEVQAIQCYEPNRNYVLTCSFTGVRDYYRCWEGQENKVGAVDAITSNTEDKTNHQQLI